MSKGWSVSELRELYNKNRDSILDSFFTFLRFESVCTEPEYDEQTLACCDWLEAYLKDAGLKVSKWESPQHPVLLASYHVDDSKPTVMLYGHYDVQPVDPIELWDSPPFEPTVKDGEVYARGAQDNKGQCFYFVSAVKALLERDGTLPVNLKLLIEGDEEGASSGLSHILDKHKEELKADHLLIVDVGFHHPQRPAVTLGVRGMMAMTVTLTGSNVDLHSGCHGGLAYNPNRALVEILSKLHDDNGKVTVPGFYDDVLPLSEENKKGISFDFDESEYEQMFSAKPIGGEKDFSALESCWIRPTLEINGVGGGYTGKGFKTVIPAQSIAKISCRLVPNQDPHKIGKMIKDYIESIKPDGVSLDIKVHDGVGAGIRAQANSAVVKASVDAVSEVNELPCNCILEGASIPITVELAKVCEADVAFVGYGLPTDRIHAPNEHFGLDRFEKGFLTIAKIIKNLEKS